MGGREVGDTLNRLAGGGAKYKPNRWVGVRIPLKI